MTRVRIDLFTLWTDTPRPPTRPPRTRWVRTGALTAAYVATRTLRERVFGDTSGPDNRHRRPYAAAHFEGVGAEIMGAAMFGLHSFPTTRTGRAGG